MSVWGIAERIDGKIYCEWQEENGVAVWQFQCNIIPLRENIDKLDCDEIISWQGVSQPKINLYFLEREKGWSTDIVQYGKTEETCIEFLFAKNELEEISCNKTIKGKSILPKSIRIFYICKLGRVEYFKNTVISNIYNKVHMLSWIMLLRQLYREVIALILRPCYQI